MCFIRDRICLLLLTIQLLCATILPERNKDHHRSSDDCITVLSDNVIHCESCTRLVSCDLDKNLGLFPL